MDESIKTDLIAEASDIILGTQDLLASQGPKKLRGKIKKGTPEGVPKKKSEIS